MLFSAHLCRTQPQVPNLFVHRAKGPYLYTEHGKKLLDFISGISVSSLGHQHPKVLSAIRKQLDDYQHVMVYGEAILQPQQVLAETLIRTLPSSFSKMYLTSSGSEAVEGAMKVAKKYTHRPHFVAFEHAYHGSTQGAFSLISEKYMTQPYAPLLPGIKHLRYNYMEDLSAIDESTAAVIIEPVQAEAGLVVPTVSYMQALRRQCDRVGALLIVDEIQTGWGRTGTFWAFTQYNIVPDIVLSAKSMGGGLPLGAFIASEEHMAVLEDQPPLSHLTTFGGHPLSCAASYAALTTILEEDLASSARDKGVLLAQALRRLPIKDVRHKGLLMGVECATTSIAQKVVQQARVRGLLIDTFLFSSQTLRLAPPLIIEQTHIDEAIEILKSAIKSAGF